MGGLMIEELAWRPDAAAWFAAIDDLPVPVWLDSGDGLGRYDILTAAPRALQRLAPGEGGLLDGLLHEWLGTPVPVPAGLPFAGGVVGYLGYELGREWEELGAAHPVELPVAVLGLYDWAVVSDHRRRRAWLVGQGRDPATRKRWRDLCGRLRAPAPVAEATPVPGRLGAASLPWPDYAVAFERAGRYLRDGDIYQVNLTRCLEAASDEPAWSLYRRLRRFSPAPYGAFMDFGDFQLLSNSPEQFLSLREGRVSTRPIKGTRPRAEDPDEDARLRAELADSPKDRAENLMIVDLLRNDLGRVCRPGSIEVPRLFAVESYATVHHLVSTVQGELAPGRDALDLLRACFPGGSVTGAPKHRAMQIIDELEPVSREVYCGSVLRLGFDGGLDSSISIRTLVRQGRRLRYWAGGGIVADSTAEAEFREAWDKAAAFLRLLGTGPQAGSADRLR